MVIFSRGGSGGRHAADEPRRSGRHAAGGAKPEEKPAPAGGAERRARGGPAERRQSAEGAGAADRATGAGPYDITDAPTGQNRVDLGSLQIPVVDGVEVRVQANPDGII